MFPTHGILLHAQLWTFEKVYKSYTGSKFSHNFRLQQQYLGYNCYTLQTRFA